MVIDEFDTYEELNFADNYFAAGINVIDKVGEHLEIDPAFGKFMWSTQGGYDEEEPDYLELIACSGVLVLSDEYEVNEDVQDSYDAGVCVDSSLARTKGNIVFGIDENVYITFVLCDQDGTTGTTDCWTPEVQHTYMTENEPQVKLIY